MFFIYKLPYCQEGNTIDTFRPISITTLFYKLLELIIKARITKLLTQNKIEQLNME